MSGIDKWLRMSVAVIGLLDPVGCHLIDPQPPTTIPMATVLWHVAGQSGLGPAGYDGSRVFFVTQNHTALALDASTGRQLWTASTLHADGTPPPLYYTYFGCTAVDTVAICGDDDLLGFRAADGKLLWRYHPSVGGSPAYEAGTVIGSTVFAGSPHGAIYAVDGETGTERWANAVFPRSPPTSMIAPVADSDIVVVAYKTFLPPWPTGGVVALDAKTGVVRWSTPFPPPPSDSGVDVHSVGVGGHSVALWHDLVLGSCDDGEIYAFDRHTGAIQWSLSGVGRAPRQPGFAVGETVNQDVGRSIAVYGSTLYATSAWGWLIAYDLPTHTELWRTEADPRLGGPNGGPFVVTAKAVYVLQSGGPLIAFSSRGPANGSSILWEAGMWPNGYLGHVTLGTDGHIYVGGPTGYYALQPPN